MTTTTKTTEDTIDRTKTAATSTAATSTTEDLTQRAREAATTVAGAADELSTRLPAAATEVDRLIRSGSDETLRAVTIGAVGFALGLFVGGANRLLVTAALVPAGLIGLVLSGRRSV
jgi:hypothetical protein